MSQEKVFCFSPTRPLTQTRNTSSLVGPIQQIREIRENVKKQFDSFSLNLLNLSLFFITYYEHFLLNKYEAWQHLTFNFIKNYSNADT